MTAQFSIYSTRLRADLPRARHLLTPARLANWLNGNCAADEAPVQNWRLFEVGYGTAAAFASGHIAGAGYLDTSILETGPWWNKVDDARLEEVLLALGIGVDTTVVLYGRNNLAAARVAQLMLYAGVRDVCLLDGGLAGWCAQGRPLVAGAGRCWPARRTFGAVVPLRPGLVVGTAQVKQLLASGDGVLVSTRSWPEFVGQTSGYPYIAARGEIAGARWGRAAQEGDVDSVRGLQDARGMMLPAALLAHQWAEQGIVAGRPVVFYCGTGWRASMAFFYAWVMGWDDIAVYDGGWCEWSADAGNAVVCRMADAEADVAAAAAGPLAMLAGCR